MQKKGFIFKVKILVARLICFILQAVGMCVCICVFKITQIYFYVIFLYINFI